MTSGRANSYEDLIDGLRVIVQRRGYKIQQGDVIVVERAIDALMRLAGPGDELKEMAAVIRDAFKYDPGHSDLDNEQPIHISVTLGDWRRLNYALMRHAATTLPVTKEKPCS